MTSDEWEFNVKSTLILVAANYAHVHISGDDLMALSKNIASELDKFFRSDKCVRDDLRNVINGIAENAIGWHLKSYGFAVFAVNLVIKHVAPFLSQEQIKILDAPLNKAELREATSYRSISSIRNYSDYEKAMNEANEYARNQGFHDLYSWELKEYNKQ